MHKLLSSLVLFLLIVNSTNAQDTCRKITFQRAFHISHYSGPWEAIPTKDSGFLISGQQTEELVGNGDGLLLKTNKYGEMQWIKGYNRPEADYVIISSTQLPDSSYLSIVYMAADQTALQKTDKNGNLVWQKHLTALAGHVSLEKIITTPDNTVIVTGHYSESIPDIGGSLIIKFDEEGNVLWQKLISNNNHRNFPAGVFAKEDTLLINGVLPLTSEALIDTVYIMKMSLVDGTIYQSKKIWLGEFWALGQHSFIKRTSDDYVLSISFSNLNSGEISNLVLNFDQGFNLIESGKLTNIEPGVLSRITPSYDNGFVAQYDDFNLSIPYLIKFNGNLIPEFGKHFSMNYRDDPYHFISSIIQTNDSGYVISGYKFLPDSNVIFLFKTDRLLNTGDCPSVAIPTPATESTGINIESYSWNIVSDFNLLSESWDVHGVIPFHYDSTLCSNSTCDQQCTIYAPNGKIYLCHVPPGNTESPQQLILPLSAVNHHLSNHPEDRVGLCGHSCTNFTLQTSNSNNSVMETVSNVSRKAIIYPNPTVNSFTVRFNETPLHPILLTVFSADGKIVYKTTSQATREISFGDQLSTGIYFVELKNQDKKEVFKIVKIK